MPVIVNGDYVDTTNGRVILSDESEAEDECEELTASLVLEVINRKADGSTDVKVNGFVTPTLSRNNSTRSRKASNTHADNPFGAQRSISSTSIPEYHPGTLKRSPAISRGHHSADHPDPDDPGTITQIPNGTPASIKAQKLTTTEFLALLAQRTESFEKQLIRARSTLDEVEDGPSPEKLSEMDEKSEENLEHTKNLYEEAKKFRGTLRKIRSRKERNKSWNLGKILILGGLCAAAGLAYSRAQPEDLQAQSMKILGNLDTLKTAVLNYLVVEVGGSHGGAVSIISVTN